MGQQLKNHYQKAEALGGAKARMRLAMITGIPSSKAESEPDSPEANARFEAALAEIAKEFK